ncbi:MAG: hypothetical protein ABJN40_05615 [Sneathiella sp.]
MKKKHIVTVLLTMTGNRKHTTHNPSHTIRDTETDLRSTQGHDRAPGLLARKPKQAEACAGD